MMGNCLNYTRYSVDEFVDDQCFWIWTLQEDENKNEFWQKFLEENPHKSHDVEQAKQKILKMNAVQFTMKEDRVLATWDKIMSSIAK